ncbi:MAG TPA: hypothetical protein DDW20_01450 [Firmicutes bacterium]|nr:hypothetical protein [Bacillota bacterium]
MSNKDIKIIRFIILAQAANTSAHYADYYERKDFYKAKERLYKKALALLKTSKHSTISYVEREEPDQNGYPSTIRYFEWKEDFLGGNKTQFSFHNPREATPTKGVKSIKWTHLKGEGDILLKKLARYYFKEGEYPFLDRILRKIK